MRSALVSEKRKDGCTMLNEYIKKSLVNRNDFDITISQTTYYLYSMNIVIMSYFCGMQVHYFFGAKMLPWRIVPHSPHNLCPSHFQNSRYTIFESAT
ncbi:MAG: hypothetical protein Q4A35_04145 [Candidatus Gracilibacteria bacterium]|nr:hypothetical protein [Candidatus Gracilibacteria bacterium]